MSFNLLNAPKERRTQLYFRDDGGFIFRRMHIEDGFLVEKDKSQTIIKAWMLRYKLQKKFKGFGRVAADMVTMSYGRDILFDPFEQLGNNEKLAKGSGLRKLFVKNIAEAKCYRHEHEAKGSLTADKIIWFLGSTIVLLGIGMLLKAAT